MTQYHENVIVKGDLASSSLGALKNETKTSKDIREISYGSGSVHILFPPKDVDLVGFPLAGSHKITDPYDLAFDYVSRAVRQAKIIGAHPVAITNILDMHEIEIKEVVPAAKAGLRDAALRYKVWIANGENAGLGDRVAVPFNISGFVLCYVPKGRFAYGVHYARNGRLFPFAVVPHKNKGVYLNSDGNGTKPEWSERLYSLSLPFARGFVQDCTAMTYDDAVKLNGEVVMDGRVLEVTSMFGNNIVDSVDEGVDRLAKVSGIPVLLSTSIVGNRIHGYGPYNMNLTGTVLSLVGEIAIKNLPKPSEGDCVIGFYNRSCRNLRCNGISDQREALVREMGNDWHFADVELLRSVAAPATVFYSFFKYLFAKNMVTQVGHFSGGAYEGKFAKVLGKHGLGADLSINGHSFPVQEYLRKIQRQTLEDICRKQSYRLEAWATTRDPEGVVNTSNCFGYEAIRLGIAKKMDKPILSIFFEDLNEKITFKGC